MENLVEDSEEIVMMVMNAIEAFYFDDGPESGTAIFAEFAAKNANLFNEEFSEGQENKLEYMTVYNEFS